VPAFCFKFQFYKEKVTKKDGTIEEEEKVRLLGAWDFNIEDECFVALDEKPPRPYKKRMKPKFFEFDEEEWERLTSQTKPGSGHSRDPWWNF